MILWSPFRMGDAETFEENFYYQSSLSVLLEWEKRDLIAAVGMLALEGINIYLELRKQWKLLWRAHTELQGISRVCLCVRRNIFRYPVPWIRQGSTLSSTGSTLCLSTRWRSHFNNCVLAPHTSPEDDITEASTNSTKCNSYTKLDEINGVEKCMLSKKVLHILKCSKERLQLNLVR